MKHPAFVLCLGCLIVLSLVTGIPTFVRAHGGDPTKIHACVGENGRLRIVGPSVNCHRNERPLDWNIQGPTGPSGSPGPPGQVNGVTASAVGGTFLVPHGITRVVIEAWGGGGGGGGSALNQVGCGNGGGGGGGGGYVRGVIEVTPGETYNVMVGAGGDGGTGNAAGQAGTDTSFETLGGALLISAGGGEGGTAGTQGQGQFGIGGVGGQGNPSGGILLSGANGVNGTTGAGVGCSLDPGSGTGAGGGSAIGARLLPASAGGKGTVLEGGTGGLGGPGYVTIQW